MSKAKYDAELISHWYKLIENFKFSTDDFYGRVDAALTSRRIPKLKSKRTVWSEGGVASSKRHYLRLTRERLVFDICAAPFGTGFFFSWRLGEKPVRLRGLLLLLLVGVFAVFVYQAQFWLSATLDDFTRYFLHMRLNWRNFQKALAGGLILLLVMSPILWLMRMAIGKGLADIDGLVLSLPLIGPFYEEVFPRTTYYRIDLALMYQETVHAAITQIIDEITKVEGIMPLSELERRPVLQAIGNQ